MRQLFLLATLTIGMIAGSAAQMAIPGEIFADNPARFNGRKVTIKNIQINSGLTTSNQPAITGSPATANFNAAPGPVGSPSAPNVNPCNPPRGFSKLNLFFKAKPEYNGCFFMADAMKTQLDRELGGQSVDAEITFRGDYRTGYNVTFYRLGM